MQLKYGEDEAEFQKFLDFNIGKLFANCAVSSIDTTKTELAIDTHFKCAAANVKIIDLIKAKEANDETYVAFEYYPPRSEDGVKNLLNRFRVMAVRCRRQWLRWRQLWCWVVGGAGQADRQ